eukprot:3739868-Pleurochrysis_carterae.AAC.1
MGREQLFTLAMGREQLFTLARGREQLFTTSGMRVRVRVRCAHAAILYAQDLRVAVKEHACDSACARASTNARGAPGPAERRRACRESPLTRRSWEPAQRTKWREMESWRANTSRIGGGDRCDVVKGNTADKQRQIESQASKTARSRK